MAETEKNKRARLPAWKKILLGVGIAGNILATWLVLTALLDLVIMPLATRHNAEREVPDLYELPLEEARKAAKKAGFKAIDAEKRFDSNHPPGVVIEQFPAPYNVSKVGRKIKLVTSSGERLYPVPDVVGVPEKEAVFKVEERGFEVSEIKRVFSDYYPRGVVKEQSVPTDTLLRRDDSIVLTVSRGALPTSFVVPELYALKSKDAEELIEDAGLLLGRVEEIHHPHAAEGLVVEQFPRPGTEVKYMSRVNLKISAGKKR